MSIQLAANYIFFAILQCLLLIIAEIKLRHKYLTEFYFSKYSPMPFADTFSMHHG